METFRQLRRYPWGTSRPSTLIYFLKANHTCLIIGNGSREPALYADQNMATVRRDQTLPGEHYQLCAVDERCSLCETIAAAAGHPDRSKLKNRRYRIHSLPSYQRSMTSTGAPKPPNPSWHPPHLKPLQFPLPSPSFQHCRSRHRHCTP